MAPKTGATTITTIQVSFAVGSKSELSTTSTAITVSTMEAPTSWVCRSCSHSITASSSHT